VISILVQSAAMNGARFWLIALVLTNKRRRDRSLAALLDLTMSGL